MNTVSLRKPVIAGILGTLAFDVVGLGLTSQFWDVPSLLGSKLGAGLAAGVALHYAIGVVLAVVYSALAPRLPGGRFTKPLTFITVQTVLGVWLFMFPLLGAGPLGLAMGSLVPVISMVRHWAYAAVLGLFIPVERTEQAALSAA